MASLVKRMQGKPFHLIYADCQAKGKPAMTSYLSSKGLTESLSNWTLTKGDYTKAHPLVHGSGYVPWYAIFDHTGRLRYDHMGGPWHGGDGDKAVKIAEKLVAEVPLMHFAKKFEHCAGIAKQLARGKQIQSNAALVEKKIAGAEEAGTSAAEVAELKQIHDVLKNYRDRQLERIDDQRGYEPERVLSALKKLAKQLKKTTLAAPVDEKLATLTKSAGHKAAKKISKGFTRTRMHVDKKAPKGPPRYALVKQLAPSLRKLIAKQPDLPISKTVEAWIVSNSKAPATH